MTAATRDRLICLVLMVIFTALGWLLWGLGFSQFHDQQRWWVVPVIPIAEASMGLVRFEGTIVAQETIEARFSNTPVVYHQTIVWTTYTSPGGSGPSGRRVHQNMISAVPFVLQDASGAVLVEAGSQTQARLAPRREVSPELTRWRARMGKDYTIYNYYLEPGQRVIVTGYLTRVDGQAVLRFDDVDIQAHILEVGEVVNDPAEFAQALLFLWLSLAFFIASLTMLGGALQLSSPWPISVMNVVLCSLFLAAMGAWCADLAPELSVGPIAFSYAAGAGLGGFLLALCVPPALGRLREVAWVSRAREPADIQPGFVRLRGRIEVHADTVLHSPYFKKPCVYYRYVFADSNRAVEPPVIDYVNFRLQRDHDAIVVELGETTVLGARRHEGIDGENQRHQEWWFEVGDTIEVVGYARSSEDGRHFILGRGPATLPFIVSRLPLRDLEASLSRKAMNLFAVGLIGVMFLIYAMQGLLGPLHPAVAGACIITIMGLLGFTFFSSRPRGRF